MGYNSLPEEGIEALTEHALGNYLPFNGGFKQHYQIRNFGKKKKPKKGVKFYAVEYVPLVVVEKSPIYFDTEKKIQEFTSTTCVSYREATEHEKKRRCKFYKWGTARGFKFYGYKKMGYVPAKSAIDRWKKECELRKQDPLKVAIHAFDYPKQSYFKIGLTNTTVEERGYFAFDKEFKKNNPNPYKKILIEKDLTDLSKKVHPADVESFIYFYLFYKYWKDKLFYFSPNKINLAPSPEHQQLRFHGYTESFLFENVEDKLKIINDAFDLLESLTKGKINTMIQNMINFERVWNRARLQKLLIMDMFNLDENSSEGFDNWVFTDRIGYSFFEKIGYWDKYIPKNKNNRKEINDKKIAELFDKKAEEFTLPNAKHYPEISNLKTIKDYSSEKLNK